MVTLEVHFDSTLTVRKDGEVIGEIAPSMEDEWAVYQATFDGRIIERRIDTVGSIEAAVKRLTEQEAS